MYSIQERPLEPVVTFLFDLSEFPFRMNTTGFGKKIWKRLTTMGTKKYTFCFTTFIFRKNTKENTTKAIRNTQIGCLTVMIVCPLNDRKLD